MGENIGAVAGNTTATAEDILEGKTAWGNRQLITGNLDLPKTEFGMELTGSNPWIYTFKEDIKEGETATIIGRNLWRLDTTLIKIR